MTYPILRGRIEGTKRCDLYYVLRLFHIVFFKIKCPGKIPNIQGIWEICPGNQWFQVGKYAMVFISFKTSIYAVLLYVPVSSVKVRSLLSTVPIDISGPTM